MPGKALAELIAGLDCKVTGNANVRVTGIACHSQRVVPGGLFVAVDGLCTSGCAFVDEAVARGARVVVSARPIEHQQPAITYVLTEAPRRFLAEVANRFYDFPGRQVKIIGVSGTNGKTTVTWLIRKIIETTDKLCGLIGTIQHFDGKEWHKALHTTPESVDIVQMLARMRDSGVAYCAAEVSSHAIALERIAGLDFAVGVFTNLSQDHLDFHGTLEEYKKTKLRFFASLEPAARLVYNADDPVGAEVRAVSRAKAFSYGIASPAAIQARNITLSDRNSKFEIVLEDTSLPIVSCLIGEHNIYNSLAAAGAAYVLGIPFAKIQEGIRLLKNVPGRLERVENRKGLAVFVDYAHSPDALAKLIATARSLRAGEKAGGNNRQLPIVEQRAQARIIVVFGCGGNRDKGKRPLMGQIATEQADWVIITSDNPRDEDPLAIISDIERGIARSNYEIVPDRYSAIKRALHIARRNDIVLIAGKGHEDYQIVGSTRQHFSDVEAVKAILGD